MPRNRRIALCLLLALLLSMHDKARAQAPVHFNANLLAFPVDVSLFSEGNPVEPGDYRVDIYLNQVWQGKRQIRFDTTSPNDRIALPCFSAELLDALGFNLQHIAADKQAGLAAGESFCAPVETLIAFARADFDVNLQRLDVSAPQIVLTRRPRGFVDPKRWDAGITAARLAYDYNAWHNKQAKTSQTSHYLSLRAGINVGDWRFRYRASANRDNGVGLNWRNSAVFAERALPPWRSALLLGEARTRSPVFDSLSFRGVRLESDDRMLPDSRNGFAPVIRGIAQSNARVRISQHGIHIFETNVPPGPFVIDDLYPNGNGGDLLVTISETDGTERRFTVTYASLPNMLRPGVFRYSVAAGRVRDRNLKKSPFFAMGSINRGVNNLLTAYGGILLAQRYHAGSSGIGLNLPVGAVTLDFNYARTQLAKNTRVGTGWRLAYSKRLHDSDTHVNLALLRYASRHYHEPSQAFRLIDQARQSSNGSGEDSKRRYQFSLSVHQQLPGLWGAVSLSGSVQDYWQNRGHETQYSLNYGRSIGRVNVNASAMRSRNLGAEHWDDQYLLSFSMPLGHQSSVHLSTSLSHSQTSRSVQNSVSGSFGEQNQYQYGVYATSEKPRRQATRGNGGASLSAATPYARLNASIAAGAGNSTQQGFHASGGVVAFRDGVVFGPELGDTVAIVQAKHAEGVKIPAATGVKLDARGHAIVPHLRPYRDNDVNLDPKGISRDVELLTTSQRVAPTHGAVVLLSYPSRRGYAVLTTLQRLDGAEIPFAASVFDHENRNVGYVAQGQQALLRVDARQGELTVRWGNHPYEQCHFAYRLDETVAQRQRDADALRRVEAICL